MKSLKVIYFLPALVLIALLGFGATGAMAYAGPSGPDGWGTSPIPSGKISPGDWNGVTGGVALGATQDVTGAGPVISKVRVKQITQNSATVTWQTDDQDSDSKVEYGTSPSVASLEFMMFATADATKGINHALALAELSPNTEYFFQVTSADGEDNTTIDDNDGEFYSFTTESEDLIATEDATGAGPVRRSFVGVLDFGEEGRGEVVVLDADSPLQLKQQGTGVLIDLVWPDATRLEAAQESDRPFIKRPGKSQGNGAEEGIEAGALGDGERVVVHAEYVDGEWIVIWVIVKPTKPSPDDLPIHGVVKTVVDGQVTIETPNGKIRTLDLNGNRGKSGEVHPGDVVTVFHGGSGKAKGLVRAAEVASRLEGFLADVEGDNDADDDEGVVGNETADERSNRRVHHAAKLESLLERLEAKHLESLDRVLAHSQGQARVDIGAAKVRLEARLARRQANFERLKAKLEARGAEAHRGDGDAVRPSRPQAQDEDGDDGDTPPRGDRPGRGVIPTPHSDGDAG